MDDQDKSPEGAQDMTFVRLTNREVYSEVMATKDIVREIRTDVRELASLKDRVEKLEGRFNGVLVGLGTGVVVGLVALFRGVIGG